MRYGSDLKSKKNESLTRRDKIDPEHKEEAGVIHGKLSLSIAPEDSTIKVDQSSRVFQQDDSYVHSHARNSPVVSASLKPLSPSLESSLYDRRTQLIQRRLSVFLNNPAQDLTESTTLTHPNFENTAIKHSFKICFIL